MDIQHERRGRLRAYIATNFPREGSSQGNVSAFASAIGMQQSQIADMLDRRKSFGEKVARRLETEAAKRKLPPMALDSAVPESPVAAPVNAPGVRDDPSPISKLKIHDVYCSRDGALIGAEWDKIEGDEYRQLAKDFVYGLVTAQKNAARRPGKVLSTGRRGPKTSVNQPEREQRSS